MKDKKKSLSCLIKQYGLMWDILDGTHHKLLTPDACNIMDLMIVPVDNLGEKISQHPDRKNALLQADSGDDHYLTIRIDTRYSPKTILNILKPILKEKHKKTKERYVGSRLSNISITSTDDSPDVWGFTPLSDGGPTDPIKKRRPDIRKWLRDFSWYDLSKCTDLNQSQITQKHFDITETYQAEEMFLVSKGISRVKKMIEAAESCTWPPEKFI